VPGTFTRVGSAVETKFIDGSTALNTKYYYRVSAVTGGGFSQPVAAAQSVTTVVGPVGTGARATYFDTATTTPASNTPNLGPAWPTNNVVPAINFNYGAAAPPSGGGFNNAAPTAFGATDYAVIWTFKIKPEFTETYTFYADVDDGAKLVVNGQTLIDNLIRRGGMGTPQASTPIALTAGQDVSVIFTMIQAGGGAGARLYWSSPHVRQEIVPQRAMYPESPDPTPPTITDFAVDGHIPSTMTYTTKFHLLFKFSEPVTGVDELDFTIDSPLGTLDGNVFDVTYDAASATAIITFPLLANEKLDDGNYTLHIVESGIIDAFGNPLDSDGSGTTGTSNIPFYVLQGDTQKAFDGTAKKDRVVDFVDYQIMSRNFGMINPSHADGDFNYDGVIDNADFVYLFGSPGVPGRFGATQPVPASTPAPTPVPVTSVPAPVRTVPPVKKPTPTPVVKKPAPPVVVKAPAPKKFATRKISDLLA
jgi:hypothetical protein